MNWIVIVISKYITPSAHNYTIPPSTISSFKRTASHLHLTRCLNRLPGNRQPKQVYCFEVTILSTSAGCTMMMGSVCRWNQSGSGWNPVEWQREWASFSFAFHWYSKAKPSEAATNRDELKEFIEKLLFSSGKMTFYFIVLI